MARSNVGGLVVYGVIGWLAWNEALKGTFGQDVQSWAWQTKGKIGGATDKAPPANPNGSGRGADSCAMIPGVRYVAAAPGGFLVVVDGRQVGGVMPEDAAQRLYNSLVCPGTNGSSGDVGAGWH